MFDIVNKSKECPFDSFLATDWKVILATEEWLSQQDRDLQTEFVQAAAAVTHRSQQECEENPELRGLAASLPGLHAFWQHIVTTLHALHRNI